MFQWGESLCRPPGRGEEEAQRLSQWKYPCNTWFISKWLKSDWVIFPQSGDFGKNMI